MNHRLKQTATFCFLSLFVVTGKACQCEDPVDTPPVVITEDMSQTDSAADLSNTDDGGDLATCPPDFHDDGQGNCTQDVCLPDPCPSDKGLRCVDDQGMPRCECEPGKSLDPQGACVLDEQCTETTCNGHGTCTSQGTTLTCACTTGYTGTFCGECDANEGYISDGKGGCTNNPCDVKSCEDPRLCAVVNDVATCVCPAGSHEENGDCVPDSTCTPTTCNGHGTCTAQNGQVQCACDAQQGWSGPFCDQCDAQAGYHPDGQGGCTTDPCLPNPCALPNQTICTDDNGVAKCGCDVGHHLENNACVIDEVCQADSCTQRGQCAVNDGVISCTCQIGTMGTRCESCDVMAGYHPDGQGGCTTDPCLPNPCTMPNKTVCVANGPVNTSCQCDPGFHPDGQGGCTDDPCLPNPCLMNNQACRDNNGQAECFTPMCNDNNPCTDDQIVNGQCTYTDLADNTACATDVCTVGQTCQQGQCVAGTARDCDDGNPCTQDSCQIAQNGCVNTVDDTIVPDDGVGCTTGVCQNGVASYNNDDTLCNDNLFCNGEERCIPTAQDADAQGCVQRNIPQAPANPSPCQTYAACDEASDSFPLIPAGTGTMCDDGIYCTTGDACNAQGQCTGTYQANCDQNTCSSTHPYNTQLNIPVAELQINMTLGGQPLPTSNVTPSGQIFFPRSFNIYAVSKDTGAWHEIVYQQWSSGNGALSTPRVLERIVPGAYDILYRRDYNSSDNISDTTYYTGDLYPNGLRYLQRDVLIGAGPNTLNIDIPVSDLQINMTLGGQPLPTSNVTPSGQIFFPRSFNIYAVSKDTGAWHEIVYQQWSSGNGALSTPRVLERIVPGTYDILYRRDYNSSDNISDTTYYTGDLYPNGLRYLQRDVNITSGTNMLNIDIPVSDLQINMTLGGQPLPTSNVTPSGQIFFPRSFNVYAVSKDTGAWHEIVYQQWSSGNGALSTPRVLERIVPGTYDILYRRDYNSSDNISDTTYYTGDLYPNGLRYLQRDVNITSGTNTLNIDIPVSDLQINMTLGGQPLPTSNVTPSGQIFFPRSFNVYAVSKDTGAWHEIVYQQWSSGNGALSTPRVLERIVPGTYDILYRRDYNSSDNISDTTYYTGDLYPNGLRYLQRDVNITSGTNTLNIDIPVSDLQVNMTLGGQPLPTSNVTPSGQIFFPRSFNVYAVSKDTGAWHEIVYQQWSSGNGALSTPRVLERIVPGTYDILYRRDYNSTNNISDTTYYTGDLYPNGLRYIKRDVVITTGMNALNLDIPVRNFQIDPTLDNRPLPLSNVTPSNQIFFPRSFNMYAVSRDTGAWHEILYQQWSSGNGALSTPRVLERIVPGTYDILYRRDYNSSDNISDTTYYTGDLYPNGLRYLDRCVEVQ